MENLQLLTQLKIVNSIKRLYLSGGQVKCFSFMVDQIFSYNKWYDQIVQWYFVYECIFLGDLKKCKIKKVKKEQKVYVDNLVALIWLFIEIDSANAFNFLFNKQ